MKKRFQCGGWWCGLALSAALVAPGLAAQGRPSSDRPPARQQPAPPRQASPPAGSYHPQNIPRQNPPPRPQNAPRGGTANRQPQYADRGRANDNRQQRGNANPRGYDSGGNRNDRPQSSYRQQTPAVPPPSVQERLRNMSPQEQKRLAEIQRKFNQLPPQKQQEMRQAGENWKKLTPEQQSHIKNDIMPKWQQMPPERQRAIQQRLGVLRNMPESARNRHLDDPNFTRGMNEEDRQMLRDLSHEHVGAPDKPQEQ